MTYSHSCRIDVGKAHSLWVYQAKPDIRKIVLQLRATFEMAVNEPSYQLGVALTDSIEFDARIKIRLRTQAEDMAAGRASP